MSERLPSLITRILKLLAFARPRAAAGALFEELEFLLQSELKEPRRYASIIAAIARGGTKLGQVVNRVPGIKDTTQITPYLEPLIRMRIIERVRSLDADENSRDNRYYVSDPLFRFYYRFILPNLSPISLGFGRQVYERQIQPHLSECMGWAFRLPLVSFHTIIRDLVGWILSFQHDIPNSRNLEAKATFRGRCPALRSPQLPLDDYGYRDIYITMIT